MSWKWSIIVGIINSPQNPTGGVLERRDIEQIAKVIGDRNIMVLSDEIYSRLIPNDGLESRLDKIHEYLGV